MRLRLRIAVGMLMLVAMSGTGLARQAEPAAGEGGPVAGTIQVPGGSLFYEVMGQGDWLVLIHDGMLHREVWEAQFAPFARQFKVVRYDRRGYGRSSIPGAPYSDLDDLYALFTQLQIDRACVAGMSAGGALALDFALAHPEKVEALVLVGAVVSGMGYTSHMATRGGHLTREILADPARARQYWCGEDPYEIAPQNAAAWAKVRALIAANPQDLDGVGRNQAQPPPRPALKFLGEIKVPTLILVGEHDIPDVHAHAGAIEAGIPGSRRVVISGAGHLIPLEQPAAFNTEVLRFLEARDLPAAFAAGNADDILRILRRLGQQDPEFLPQLEAAVNQRAYQLLQGGRADDALALFQVNAEVFPDSWNVYDSLGEALAARGQTELAVRAYRRSLELNPANDNGRNALKRLEGP
ncbi:MAG: alpha/beta fold hydrolase [Candidatus Krumholzibacteriia bacterium]